MQLSEPRSEDRKRLSRLQKTRKIWLRAAIVPAAIGLAFIRSAWPAGSLVHEGLTMTGVILVAICILGRAWCILYIGGRKANELVALGPYSVSRNPLYLFSFAGSLGVGLQSGSVVVGLAFLCVAFVVFDRVVRREEEILARTFGTAFEAYKARVPRFGPRLATWQDAEQVSVAPTLLYLTVRDSLVFACACPVFKLVALAQDAGYIPALLTIV